MELACPKCSSKVTLDTAQTSNTAIVQCGACGTTFDPRELEKTTDSTAPAKPAEFELSESHRELQPMTPAEAAALMSKIKVPPAKDPPPRKVIKSIGAYDIISEINRGGMGIVYHGVDRQLKRQVAIKVLLAGEGATEEDVKRFQREAQATARLHHPNIVPIFAVGTEDGKPYLVMDYVEGRTAKQLKEEGKITPRLALSIMECAAEGLSHAHMHGVIHRDVKPANIIVDKNERAQIMDFGLARRVDEDLTVTQAGTTMGTPSYMAPEQASGKLDEVDAQSDVYSAGACLYELLTGVVPFEAPTIMAVLRKVLDETPIPPRKLNPKIHVDVETICLKCLEKEKPNRYRSAKELAEDIRRFNAGEAITAKPVGFFGSLYRSARRHKEVTLATMLVVLSGLAALGYVWNESHRTARIQVQQRENSFNTLLGVGNQALLRARSTLAVLNDAGSEDFQQNAAKAKKMIAEASTAFRQAESIAPESVPARDALTSLQKLENELEVRRFINKARMFLNPSHGPDEPAILPNYAGAEFAAQEAIDRDPENTEAREILRAAVGIRNVAIDTEGDTAEVFARKIIDSLGRVLPSDPDNDAGKSLGMAPVRNKQLEPGIYVITFRHGKEPIQQATLAVTREAKEAELYLKIPLKEREENMALITEGSVTLPQVGVVKVGPFAIDRFEYPNKAGVVPLTEVTFLDAQSYCKQQNKRLCTSAQWLRACMGNDERRYPYGKQYISQSCAAGFDGNIQTRPLVSGQFSRCRTAEGIYDMSGNAAEWTDSERQDSDQESVFGGDWTSSFSVPDLTISCRGRRLPAEVNKQQLGFRCCKAK